VFSIMDANLAQLHWECVVFLIVDAILAYLNQQSNVHSILVHLH
jgi:hypothetical protein